VGDPAEAASYRAQAAECRAEFAEDPVMAAEYFAQAAACWTQVAEYKGADPMAAEYLQRAAACWTQVATYTQDADKAVACLTQAEECKGRIREYSSHHAKHPSHDSKRPSLSAQDLIEAAHGCMASVKDLNAAGYPSEATKYRIQAAGYLVRATHSLAETAEDSDQAARAQQVSEDPHKCWYQTMEYLKQAAKYATEAAEIWDVIDRAEGAKCRALAAEKYAKVAECEVEIANPLVEATEHAKPRVEAAAKYAEHRAEIVLAARYLVEGATPLAEVVDYRKAQASLCLAQAELFKHQVEIAKYKTEAALYLAQAYEYSAQVEMEMGPDNVNPDNVTHCQATAAMKRGEAANYQMQAAEKADKVAEYQAEAAKVLVEAVEYPVEVAKYKVDTAKYRVEVAMYKVRANEIWVSVAKDPADIEHYQTEVMEYRAQAAIEQVVQQVWDAEYKARVQFLQEQAKTNKISMNISRCQMQAVRDWNEAIQLFEGLTNVHQGTAAEYKNRFCVAKYRSRIIQDPAEAAKWNTLSDWMRGIIILQKMKMIWSEKESTDVRRQYALAIPYVITYIMRIAY
jgi:hypothetical protein